MERLSDFLCTEEFQKFRNVQLNLLIKFQEICRNEDIEYFAMFGTLLGAVRHNGYIPWDDDIDVVIWRKDVPKLRQCPLDEGYEFVFTDDDTDFTCNIIRFMDATTTYIDMDTFSKEGKYGISIDIEIIDNTFSNSLLRKLKSFMLEFMYEVAFNKRYGISYCYLDSLSESRKRWVSYYSKRHSYKSILKRIEQLHLSGNQNSKYCSVYHYKQYPLLDKSWFEKSVDLKFENIELKAPMEWDRCLISIFGSEYMNYPPVEEQIPRHLCNKFIDVEVPYSQVIYSIEHFDDIPTDKCLVIWGAGNMANHYFNHFGSIRKPDWIIDNDQKKWGMSKWGCQVVGPDILLNYKPDEIHIIICNIYFREIMKQIKAIGEFKYHIYWEKYIDSHLGDYKVV